MHFLSNLHSVHTIFIQAVTLFLLIKKTDLISSQNLISVFLSNISFAL